MKALKIKRALEDALDSMQDVPDNYDVPLQSNTYFVRDASFFLGIRGGGYVDLDKLGEMDDDGDQCHRCGGEIIWNEDGSQGLCTECGEEV